MLYNPPTWMFHSKTTKNSIKKLHVGALRLVYNDCEGTFEYLLTTEGSFTVYHYNIQILEIELYKVCNNIYLKQLLGNFSQETIMVIICVQNLVLSFCKLRLH